MKQPEAMTQTRGKGGPPFGPGDGRKKVVMVTPPVASSGGIGRCVGYLLGELEARGERDRIVLVDSRGARGPIASLLKLPLALLKTAMLLATGRTSVLHVNVSSHLSTFRKLPFVFLGRAFRTPVVVHLHGGRYVSFYRSLPRAGRWYVRAGFRAASRTIVLGKTWKAFVTSELRVPVDRVAVVYNAVPGPADKPERVKVDEPCILFLGRLGDGKGVPELLQALASPNVRRMSWRAVIAGDGDIERFKAAAVTLGVSDRVEFPGWIAPDRVHMLLGSAEILTLPSHAEGLPLSVLEGMAYGLCVICTRVGALEEAIRDDMSGLLVDAGDTRMLARAIVRVLRDESVRHQLGHMARETWERHFDVGMYPSNLAAVYAEATA